MIRTFVLRLAAAAAIGVAVAIVIARPAPAASLRDSITVTGDVVTLGDLFDGAGVLAERPVFRSPDPGVEGALPAADALAAARDAGLSVDPTTLQRVLVARPSITVEIGDIVSMLLPVAAERLGIGEADVRLDFDRAPEVIHADPRSTDPIRLAAFGIDVRSGRFSAELQIDLGETDGLVALSGRAEELVEVPYLLRDVLRDAVIAPAEVEMRRLPKRQVNRGAVTELESVVGMAARRGLRAGSMLALADVSPPTVVRRNALVTLIFERPGLTLTARGRALTDAAVGEPVSVLNEQSRRTVHGLALASGAVRVDAQSPLVVGNAALTQ